MQTSRSAIANLHVVLVRSSCAVVEGASRESGGGGGGLARAEPGERGDGEDRLDRDLEVGGDAQGLAPGELFGRLRRSGLGRADNLGQVSEAELAGGLAELYGLDRAATGELLADLWERIYLLTCERLGVRPGEAVFLDDLEANVEAARKVGMRAVLFRTTGQAIADVRAWLEEGPALSGGLRVGWVR
jgi:hypothetical protein